MLAFGPYRFDPVNRILSRDGEEMPLPPRALAVLACLLDPPGRIVSKKTLLEVVWNGAYVNETSLSEAVGVLRQALQDDPQEPRYIQTVHRRGYRFIAPVDEEEPAAPAATDLRFLKNPRVAAAAVALATMVAVLLLDARGSMRGARYATRFAIIPPAPNEVITTKGSGLAVSRDGRHIVYTARRPGRPQTLWYRDLAGFATRELAHTESARTPFFSPDGRRVGFFADGQVLAVPLSGGPALPLARISGSYWGASWAADDTLVFAAGGPSSLYRMRRGKAPERLTLPDPARGEYSHRWPRLLPGDEAVIFTSCSTMLQDSRIEWLSLVDGERRTVLTGGADAHFADGMLVWAGAAGSILAAPFDPKRGRLAGEPLVLLRGQSVNMLTSAAQIAAGGDTLVYLPEPHEAAVRWLERIDASGRRTKLAVPKGEYRNIEPGPHDRLAVTMVSRDRQHSDVWIVGTAAGTFARLTFGGFNIEPVWSPDGRWLAFGSASGGGPLNVHRRRADGSGAVERLLASPQHQIPLAWSPDGRELMLHVFDPETSSDLWVLDLATRKARPWLRTRAEEGLAVWSPDGKWVAYTTDESGRAEVYVRSYPDGAGQWQISRDGGLDPAWSADGKTLYFHEHMRVRAVAIETTGRGLVAAPPTVVIDDDTLVHALPGRNGEFYVIEEEQRPQQQLEVRVVVGWRAGMSATYHARIP